MDITTIETQWKQKMNQHIGVDPSRFYLQQDDTNHAIYLCSSDLYQQHQNPCIMTYYTNENIFMQSFPNAAYHQHIMHAILYAADCFVQCIKCTSIC